MARDFQINGPTLVTVKFGQHVPVSLSNIAGSTSNLSELGLASEGIRITPRFSHVDLHPDDFGPEIPAETLQFLADVNISMTLVHYDPNIVDICIAESLGGLPVGVQPGVNGLVGTMNPTGTPLGGYVPYLQSGYHHVSLSLSSPVQQFPWHFPATSLVGPAITLPLGTERSLIQLNFRAIPYNVPTNDHTIFGTVDFAGEVTSSGAICWDHLPDLT